MKEEPAPMPLPSRHGLYDPTYEHDACGFGFVASLEGAPSHEIVREGIEILKNLVHRGACGCDPLTGDGAGLLLQIPHEFFAAEAARLGFALPEPGRYGVGFVFLPPDAKTHERCRRVLEDKILGAGQRVLGWRDGPRCEAGLGRRAMPATRAVRERLDAELGVIETLGYPSYFLTVADVVDLIRDMGVRVAARGSGAGSLVNYLLGVSGVDPMRHGLLMERFLSPLREALPDVDVDVESARRTEVYERILDRSGGERVACVSMMDTYRVRHAVRDVGAALGMPPGDWSPSTGDTSTGSTPRASSSPASRCSRSPRRSAGWPGWRTPIGCSLAPAPSPTAVPSTPAPTWAWARCTSPSWTSAPGRPTGCCGLAARVRSATATAPPRGSASGSASTTSSS
jgi:hypothetical protein